MEPLASPTATWKRQKKFTPTRSVVASPQAMKTRSRRTCQALLFSPEPEPAAKRVKLDIAESPKTEVEDDAATDDVGEEVLTGFTSSSKIEDVGLFNCDQDVEFSGGLYGEGTDGKVSACSVHGQKVALKRAKPHDGFTKEQAKHKTAVELHYLRRVRHKPGFIQCLGMCDGIEHTCIALEVMDCKLSDYQRKRMGHKKPFPQAVAHRLLKQIAQAMMILHEEVDAAHGDLACRNILVRMPPKGFEDKFDPEIKLSDFGRIKTKDDEPPILKSNFSFYKNADVGSFGRDVLYRLLVGDVLPATALESRSLHRLLQDSVVKALPDGAAAALGPYEHLFKKCVAWGVRPSFRMIHDHLESLEVFESFENGLFPLKPNLSQTPTSTTKNTGADPSLVSPNLDGIKRNLAYQLSSQSKSVSKKQLDMLYQSPPAKTKENVTPVAEKVNWLRPRSVGPTTATTSTSASKPGGASRRSLKILSEISKQRYRSNKQP
ncbi:serine/threonine protein kinase [Saprolegnia parasitica CBS 223.65]|uniref:Serine/threonine protein kinase n=1 Tax=Saprolegnia parasitica (strain CBS 223.65) TaxID=695850 RepID=A0A067CJ21_SAPPC|nr:serine/threonine protein kinase [Saprolegnia parasitica CBS 223.65]KDO30533.1 serine/threonine protein kinase [Saprolegnia parasitica CBS 223.65]|eukprot:XP_012198748.1 serine/threonine protein kinase [Saprolegnia parasitica CBS 223.65]